MTIMPCQCGARSEPDLVQIQYTAEQESCQVRCLRCKASSPACDSQAAAINAWNRLVLAVSIAEAYKRYSKSELGTWDGSLSRQLYNILISIAILSLLSLAVGWWFLFTLWKAVAAGE